MADENNLKTLTRAGYALQALGFLVAITQPERRQAYGLENRTSSG